MTNREIISIAEQNLLLTLTLAICLCLYVGWGIKAIDDYNRRVRIEEEQKLNPSKSTTGSGKIDINFSCGSLPLYPLLLELSFITFPLAFFALRSRKVLGLILAADFSFLALIGYSMWYFDSIFTREFQDGLDYELRSLNEFVLTGSTSLEFLAAILVSVLFVLQLTFLYRCVAELLPKRILLK